MPKLIYLGSPYTHKDEKVREGRFFAVARAAGWLFTQQGIYVYAPISMTHQMWLEMREFPNVDFKWEAWAAFDEFMVQKCDEFWILTTDGWKQSVGVNAETAIAKKLGLPIRYVVEDGAGYKVVDEPPTTFLCNDPNCYENHCSECRQPVSQHDKNCSLALTPAR